MVGRDVYDLLRAYLHSRTAPAWRRVSLLAHPAFAPSPRPRGRRKKTRLVTCQLEALMFSVTAEQ